MRRAAAIAVVLMALVSTACGRRAEFVCEKGGFAVWIPASYARDRARAAALQIAEQTSTVFLFEDEDPRYAYTVAYFDDWLPGGDARSALAAARDRAVQALGAKIASEKVVELNGHPGLHVEVDGPKRFDMRMYFVKGRLYQMAFVFSKGHFSPEREDRFFGSFRLLGD